MRCHYRPLSFLCYWVAYSKPAGSTVSFRSLSSSLPNLTSPSIALDLQHDPNFWYRIDYDETELPVTPVFLNSIELMAQVAEVDPSRNVRQRNGIVLSEYPQIEIAILPPTTSRSIEVQFVLWGLYAVVSDMVLKSNFKQCEISMRWMEEAIGDIYITLPLNETNSRVSRNQNSPLNLASLADEDKVSTGSDTTNTSLGIGTGRFDWTPIWKPHGGILRPTDVFLMAMSVIKSTAGFRLSEKVPQAFFIASILVDANMQFFLHDRLTPRPRPPYFQYQHVIDVARRMARWMLGQRRFAEFYCLIRSNGVQVGQAYLAKGNEPQPFAMAQIDGNTSSGNENGGIVIDTE